MYIILRIYLLFVSLRYVYNYKNIFKLFNKNIKFQIFKGIKIKFKFYIFIRKLKLLYNNLNYI